MSAAADAREALEAGAGAIGETLGTHLVSEQSAALLRELLPGADSLRASVRCGTALLVSGDLLTPGENELTVASLKRSLAGVALARRQPVVVAGQPTTPDSAARLIVCVPVALQPTEAAEAAQSSEEAGGCGSSSDSVGAADVSDAVGAPLLVGALTVTCRAAQPQPGGPEQPAVPPPELWAALQGLARAAGPYLLLQGLALARDVGPILGQQPVDWLEDEEVEEEAEEPAGACAPDQPPGGSGGDAAGTQAAAGLAVPAGDCEAEPAGPGGRASGSQPYGKAQQQQEEEEAEDPKAAIKRQRSALTAAAARQPAPRLPLGPLLAFPDPAAEARFAAAQSWALAPSDAMFAAMHLAAALCLVVVRPQALLRSWAVLAFVAALGMLALALLLAPARYCRHRELVLAVLLVAHAELLRSCSLPTLLRLMARGASGAGGPLVWLRATGAEALAVFPLGFKLRLRIFLPVQALCLALVLSIQPAPCAGPWLAAAGCVPSSLGRLGGAALTVALAGLLPTLVVYSSERRSRERFAAARRRLAASAAAARA